MRLNNIYIIIISILFLLNVYLLFNIKELHSKINQPDTSLQANHKIAMASGIDGRSVLDTNCILSDINSNEITLSKLLEERGGILVLNISKLNCGSCVDKSVEILNSFITTYKQQIKTGKAIIIYRDSNKRDLVLLRKSVDRNIEIYQIIDSNKLQLKMNELNMPFFFVLDSSSYPEMIHVTNKLFPDFTREYLKIAFDQIINRDFNYLE